MDVRRLVLLSVTVATMSVAGAVAAPGANASTTTPCAQTVAAPGPSTPAAGHICWTDVTPYPFGVNGDAMDPNSLACKAFQHQTVGDPPCELTVGSMAFRAWNRGLASMQDATPYGVWLFNGARWYPDPTFPGQSQCGGVSSTVLWAGKLDYWLIGGVGASGICRFDGVNFAWEPLSIPAASLARVPIAAQPGFALNAGACFAWDNCWFFGSFGVVDHWDGQSLTDASPGLGSSPWLGGRYTAAATGVDASGNPFGLAVGSASTIAGGAGSQELPAEPDGTPPPQLFGSLGAAFSPVPNSPAAALWASSRSDLVAVGADRAGGGWVAGNPEGMVPKPFNQRGAAGPAPLIRVSAGAGAVPCKGYDAGTFSFNPFGSGQPAWLWHAVSVYPDSGNALAGGQYASGATGTDPNDDGHPEPVLVTGACGQAQAPAEVRFRIPDPRPGSPPSAPLVPANRDGYVTAVAANAGNDAWAATTSGGLDVSGFHWAERPRLYHLTDGQPPNAPAGDDSETRALVFKIDPPIYVQSPGVVPPPPPVDTSVTHRHTTTKNVKLKPAVYAVKAGKPTVGRGGRITLQLKFKVRRPVTIGIEALRGHTVVSSSGLKHFGGKAGTLVLTLDRRRWPTRLRFITPAARKRGAHIVAASTELTWVARIPG